MYDVIIIGTGPAGLICGVELSKTNLNVLILEKNNVCGKKLLLTGGSRCNLTNLKPNKEFLDNVDYNKKYLYSTIYNFGPREVYDYFSSKINLKEEIDNRIFPASNKSSDILNVLLEDIKFPIINNSEVLEITPLEKGYLVKTKDSEYKTLNIVIATGGGSYPKTGSTLDSLKFASMLVQPIVDVYPAEVGIVLEEVNNIPGISIDNVVVTNNNVKKEGNLIYTHVGLSGESIMKISEFIYLNNSKSISIDLLPNIPKEELIGLINSNKEKNISTFLTSYFPKRFINYLLQKVNIEDRKIKQLIHRDINIICSLLKELNYKVKKVNDLEVAYVTGGGIDINYLDNKTFESKLNRGAYFIGEAVDIHGPIGGYNITLALSTGYSCAKGIINK